MKISVLRNLLLLSTAAAAVEDKCGVDEVLSSLSKITKGASAMPTLTDKADDSIDSDSPVVADVEALMRHFNADLRCDLVIEDAADQQRVCEAYTKFAAEQKESVDVTLDPSFKEENGEGSKADEVHSYTVHFQDALDGYTDRIKAGVPSCADAITDAYAPVQKDMALVLSLYPAADEQV